MSIDTAGILNAVTSHALASGLFESVNGHEPKSAPGNGLTVAIWADLIEAHAAGSGLAVTAGRVVLNVRIYSSMLAEPQDAIDPAMVAAVDALFAAYCGDFELGGTVRNVDILGQAGTVLRAQAGYINQDSKLFRVMTITLPLIVNDAWEQAP